MSKLLNLSLDANFYLYRKPVKMSRSFDGLAALILIRIFFGRMPFTQHLSMTFRNPVLTAFFLRIFLITFFLWCQR